MTNLDSVLQSRDITLLTKVLIQGYGLPSGHVRFWELWELDHKESRMPKNWCLQTSIVVLKKTPEILLDSKDIKPVNLKGDQSIDAEAEAPVFWSSDANRQLIGKVPDARKDWEQKKKRASEDEMAGWHHWCSEHELGQTLGDGEGQEGLACWSPWGCKESDTSKKQQQLCGHRLETCFLPHTPLFLEGCLGIFMTWKLAFSRASNPRERAGSKPCALPPGLRSHTVSCVHYSFH